MTDPIYDIGALTRKPRRVSGPIPQYPDELRRKEIECSVLVETVLSTQGVPEPGLTHVRNVSTDAPEFRKEALRVILESRFEPGTVNDLPVRARVIVPVVFKLDETFQAWDW